MTKWLILLWITLSLSAWAQSPPPVKPAPPTGVTASPSPIHLTEAAQNAILRAERDLYSLQSSMKDTNIQFMTKYQEVLALKAAYAADEKKVPAAQKAVDDAIAGAWKESGLDKEKWDFDAASFTFSPKKVEVKK